MNIVLVHGVLGAHAFGALPYFNGVEAHLRTRFGAKVLATNAAAIGTVAVRAAQARKQILDHFGATPSEPLILIAYSMGGLDARQMLTDDPALAKHVRSLTCIATPHHGSPVASMMSRILAVDAVHDLSEEGARRIDARCADYPHIHYREIAGVGRAHPSKTSKALALAARAGMSGEHDGVVSFASAVPPGRTLLERAEGDHVDLIGHDLDDFPLFRPRAFDHLPLYERIVADAMAH